MRIVLRSNIELGGPFDKGILEAGDNEATLRDVLEEISKDCGLRFIDPDKGDIDPQDYAVSVNGREYWLLQNGLDIKLRNEDEVKVDIVILGGG